MPIFTAADLIKLTSEQKSILVYGPPFTGKTRSLVTLMKWLKRKQLGPLVLFDLDLKCESLVYAAQNQNLLDWLQVIRPAAAVADIIEANARRGGRDKEPFLAFQKELNVFCNAVDPQTGKFRTNFAAPGAIFIDSLTKFQEIVMEFILGTLGHDLGDKGTDSRADYGKQMNKVMEAVQVVKSLPCITGWLAHDQMDKDEFVGKIIIQPLVTGKKLPGQLAKEFNCVLYSTSVPSKDNQPPKYMWQIMPDGRVVSAGITGKDATTMYVEQDYDKLFG